MECRDGKSNICINQLNNIHMKPLKLQPYNEIPRFPLSLYVLYWKHWSLLAVTYFCLH